MLRYATLGSDNLAQARAFYDAVLAPLGMVCRVADDADLGYGPPAGTIPLWIVRPFDGRAASCGNGSMLAFEAPDRATVDAFYRAGIAAGGLDEGAPGLRAAYGPDFYACYLRDPQGNKLSAVCAPPD